MRVPIKTPSADDLLRQFKEDLDQWFGLSADEQRQQAGIGGGPLPYWRNRAESPVKPEHRLTADTAKRFADLCRADIEPSQENDAVRTLLVGRDLFDIFMCRFPIANTADPGFVYLDIGQGVHVGLDCRLAPMAAAFADLNSNQGKSS